MVEPESRVPVERLSRPALLALAAMVLIAGAARWMTRSQALDQLDVLFFVRGVVDYSVEDQRPHFPGYPVFIWAAKAARWLFPEPLEAVHAVALSASTLIAVPLALVTAALCRGPGSSSGEWERTVLASAALWLVVPGSWVTGSEGFSDSLGLLFATFALWCAWRGWDGPSGWAFLAGVLAGVTLGTRLVCVALLGPLALLVLRQVRAPGGPWRRVAGLAGLVSGCLPWLAWQVAMDGWGLLRAARRHVSGHFKGWGESAMTDPSVWTRPLRMMRTVIVYGLGGGGLGQGPLRLIIAAAFLALLGAGAVRLVRRGGDARLLFLVWTAGYAVYVTFAHDVEYPRYSLPLTAAVCVVAALGLPRGWPGALTAAALGGLVLTITIPLAVEHRRSAPTELQLAEYMNGVPPPAVLFSSLDSHPMVYSFLEEKAPGVERAAAEPESMGTLAASFVSRGRAVYATFPDAARPGDWIAVARFCRDELFDPRSAPEIWLFRHEPGASPRAVPECHQRP